MKPQKQKPNEPEKRKPSEPEKRKEQRARRWRKTGVSEARAADARHRVAVMRFQRDPCQERTLIGTMQELCLCGAEFGSHYNGQCPVQTFNPRPCPCGCKKWIMSPTFGCQCSSVSTKEKDELMAMARDAELHRNGFVEHRAVEYLRGLGYSVSKGGHVAVSRVKDLTGNAYGRLVVLRRGESIRMGSRWRTMWTCRCSCGNETTVDAGSLTGNKTKSCGCLNDEMRRSRISYNRDIAFFKSKQR